MNIEQFKATLVPGELCNVSLDHHTPLMRIVTKVEERTKGGQQWLFWFWQAGDDTPADYVARRGFTDCGYSGLVIG